MKFRGHMLLREAVLIVAVLAAYAAVSSLPWHSRSPDLVVMLIVALAAVKVLFFLLHTFRQISGSLDACHSFNELLAVLGLVTFTLILSFALDFVCLAHAAPGAFSGVTAPAWSMQAIFEFLYFSIVTFATIGYGDIVALTPAARILVILEIMTSFVMIVFILSNFDRIRSIRKF